MTMTRHRPESVTLADYRHARGVFATCAGIEISKNESMRQPVVQDVAFARDLIRSLRIGLGDFGADIVTEATFDVPAQALYEPSRMDPALCVAASTRTVFKCRPGASMLRFTGLTMDFRGAADGQIPTLDDAQGVCGREVASVGPVLAERAFITFIEPLCMGPAFPVSPETLTRLMDEASKDATPIEVMPFARAMEHAEALIKTALEKEGVIDLAGQVPSAVDPVAHPEDPAKLLRLGTVIANELSQRGWGQIPYLSHRVWISPTKVQLLSAGDAETTTAGLAQIVAMLSAQPQPEPKAAV